MSAMMSCTQEPRPIVYGNDECHFCMMKIMDQRFGAETVTEKGKVFKFDSAECLLRYLNGDAKNTPHQHLLVTHISQPNQLQNATNSFYVVSKKIPSPMGGNLSAYPDKTSATAVLEKNGGEVYSWTEILESYSKK